MAQKDTPTPGEAPETSNLQPNRPRQKDPRGQAPRPVTQIDPQTQVGEAKAEKAKAEKEQQPAALAAFTDRDLCDELRRRGWSITFTDD